MTPWLNRGAKKTNEPTIPLILQAFGWLNRAALARAADRTSAAAAHDRSFAPNRIRSWTSASRRPGGAKAGRPQCQCEAGAAAAAPARTQIQMAASSHSGAAAAPAGRSAGGAPSLGSASHARAEISAIKVNDAPKPLIFQCHASAMTPWLNRGAKKTNEPTIPLIFQAFGWLNRAALARAADRTAAAAHDSIVRPKPNTKLDVGQPPPRRCQSGSARCIRRSRRLARAGIRRQ